MEAPEVAVVNMDKHSFKLFSVLCILTALLCLCYFKYSDWIDIDKNISYRRLNIKWYDQLTHAYPNMQPVNISNKTDVQGDSTAILYTNKMISFYLNWDHYY